MTFIVTPSKVEPDFCIVERTNQFERFDDAENAPHLATPCFFPIFTQTVTDTEPIIFGDIEMIDSLMSKSSVKGEDSEAKGSPGKRRLNDEVGDSMNRASRPRRNAISTFFESLF